MPTNNVLQNVQTYNDSALARLLNSSCLLSTSNTKFKEFNNMTANLGSTVTFDLPPRFVTNDSLVATFQPAKQRVETLTVDNAKNVAYEFTAEQYIFNVDEYMDKFGDSAMAELSTKIERDVFNSAVEQPYRFFGDGVSSLSNFTQVSSMITKFATYGIPTGDIKAYLADTDIPNIVGSGLNQFVLDRNERMAMDWEIGRFQGTDFYKSNLLPLHVSGNTGEEGVELNVVSTTVVNGAITQITFDNATPSDADAVKQNDLFRFINPVTLRYLTFTGHEPSATAVEFRATADAASNGAGEVTIDIFPPLVVDPTSPESNITQDIVAGMTAKGLPSHRRGMLVSGKGLFLGMPQLPDERPFDTARTTDADTGVSLRMYYGSTFGQNKRGTVNDVIYGYKLVPEYSMAYIVPLV